MRIRPAAKGDIGRLTAVVNAAFAIETFLEGPRADEARMAAAMQTGEFLVAEDDEGMITACVRIEQHGGRGGFGMLAVDPDRQGNGLGPAMVRAAEARCRALGCTDMDITVLSLRAELLPFYRALGYEQAGTKPFRPSRPLADGTSCHAILMTRKL
jgi:predicted N-acetyltransferase YhbS